MFSAGVFEIKNNYFGIEGEINTLVQQAGENFMKTIAAFVAHYSVSGSITYNSLLFNQLNKVSLRKYETAETKSTLLLSARDSFDADKLDIQLNKFVNLSEDIKIRTLLEIAKDDFYLVLGNSTAYGFVRNENIVNVYTEESCLFLVKFNGVLDW